MIRTTAGLRSIVLAWLGCTLVTARASAEPEPEKTVNEVREAAREKVHEAREAIHEARDKAKAAIKQAKETAAAKAGEVEAETGQALEGAKDKAKEAVKEAKDKAKEAVKEAKDKAKEAVQSAKQDVAETKREVLEGAHEKLRETMGPKEHDRAERARAARRTAWIGFRNRWRAPAEIPADMRVELRKHAVRVAKLTRIRSLASEKDDKPAVERADKLLTVERARHRAVIAKLMKAHPPQARPNAQEEEEDEEDPQEGAEEEEEEEP